MPAKSKNKKLEYHPPPDACRPRYALFLWRLHIYVWIFCLLHIQSAQRKEQMTDFALTTNDALECNVGCDGEGKIKWQHPNIITCIQTFNKVWIERAFVSS